MQQYQREFIRLALDRQALKFGNFELKSGRTSPYFFNAGSFQSGSALAALATCYAAALVDSGVEFDLLFGPAYKGIPLAAATAMVFATGYDRDVPYCFNRKEAKSHGEGGRLVGAPLTGRVVIVDDVITAGTAVREVMEILSAEGAVPAAVLVGLDRQERGSSELSAIQEVERDFGVPVVSIVRLEHIMEYLAESGADTAVIDAIQAYRLEYGVGG